MGNTVSFRAKMQIVRCMFCFHRLTLCIVRAIMPELGNERVARSLPVLMSVKQTRLDQ